MRLIDDITLFLEREGFECDRQMCGGFDVISVRTHDGLKTRFVLPLEIFAASPEEACEVSRGAIERIGMILRNNGCYPLVITEDRWHLQKTMMQSRLLAHLEVFTQAFARNCEVRRIEKIEAQTFLQSNHSYGDAACKYRYGLFLKRQTGHLAEVSEVALGTLIAVATFSNARRWVKGGKEIRSYEWTRFASLPGMRVSGGMGKMLKTFIKDVAPDDVMSYADLEWSEGDVYEALGFTMEGLKDPVMFAVDKGRWTRSPLRAGMADCPVTSGVCYFRNFGSNKYRLKLTDYE